MSTANVVILIVTIALGIFVSGVVLALLWALRRRDDAARLRAEAEE